MRRRARLLIILGIVLAVVAGLLTFVFLQQPAEEVAQVPTTVQVVVATENIGLGELVDPLTIELREWPADTAPVDAVTNVADLTGKYAREEIFSGQVVRTSMIASKAALAAAGELASALVPVGLVAYPFPISELSGVSYALSSGDRVDVLITFHFLEVDRETQVPLPLDRGLEGDILGVQIPRLVSQLTLQDIEVLRVGSWYEPPELTPEQQQQRQQTGQTLPTPTPPAVVTLLMPQQDALVLQFAREAGATVDLALRNPTDRDTVSTESVTLDYMLARFNFTVPILRDESLDTLSTD
jgi:pilus assembly protein CpaB